MGICKKGRVMFETLDRRESRERKPFPNWLRLMWMIPAPLGIALSARIFWEKTLLTAQQGEQMIGFSMIHIYPGFFFTGSLCAAILLVWLFPAAVYFALASLKVGIADYAMLLGSLFVLLSLLLPDNFGLKLR